MAIFVALEILGRGAEHAEAAMAVAERISARVQATSGRLLMSSQLFHGDVVRWRCRCGRPSTSRSCMAPLRAPTTRSVPEMVSAKLWRAPVLTFSTPSSSMTLTAMASTVSVAVSARLRSDCDARRRMIMMRALALSWRFHSSAARGRSCVPRLSSWLTMISDAPAAASFREQQIEEGLLAIAVEGGRRLVGDDQLGAADQARGLRRRAAAGRRSSSKQRHPRAPSTSRPRLSRRRSASALGRLAASCPLSAFRREAQRQQHIVEDGAVGQQIEHLVNDAHGSARNLSRAELARASPGPCRGYRGVLFCGATMPASRLNTVDLPLPEGPTSSTRSRGRSAKLRWIRKTAGALAR